MATSKIHPTTGDYPTITAWEAATSTDLVSATEGEIGEVYDNGGTYDESVTIAGATTNATYFRTLRAPAAEHHDGTPGTGPIIRGNNNSDVLTLSENYFVVEWLEVKTRGTYGTRWGFGLGNLVVTVRYCLSTTDGGGHTPGFVFTGYSHLVETRVYNNAQIGGGTFWGSGDTHRIGGSGVIAYNTSDAATVFDMGAAGSSATVTLEIVNNVWHGMSSDAWSDTAGPSYGTMDYNASNRTSTLSLPGTHNVYEVSSGNFVGGGDYHLAASSVLEGAGTPTSYISVTDDVDGNPRDGSTPDIGFDEYVATRVTTRRRIHYFGGRFRNAWGLGADQVAKPSLEEPVGPLYVTAGTLTAGTTGSGSISLSAQQESAAVITASSVITAAVSLATKTETPGGIIAAAVLTATEYFTAQQESAGTATSTAVFSASESLASIQVSAATAAATAVFSGSWLGATLQEQVASATATAVFSAVFSEGVFSADYFSAVGVFSASESLAALQQTPGVLAAATTFSASESLASQIVSAVTAAATTVFSASESLAALQKTPGILSAATTLSSSWLGTTFQDSVTSATATAVFSAVFSEGIFQVSSTSVSTAFSAAFSQNTFVPTELSAATTLSASWLGSAIQVATGTTSAAAVFSASWMGTTLSAAHSGSTAGTSFTASALLAALTAPTGASTATAVLSGAWSGTALQEAPGALQAATQLTGGASLASLQAQASYFSAVAVLSGSVFEGTFPADFMSARSYFSASELLASQQVAAGNLAASAVFSGTAYLVFAVQAAAQVAGTSFTGQASLSSLTQTPSALTARSWLYGSFQSAFEFPVDFMTASTVLSGAFYGTSISTTPGALASSSLFSATHSLSTLYQTPGVFQAAAVLSGTFQPKAYFPASFFAATPSFTSEVLLSTLFVPANRASAKSYLYTKVYLPQPPPFLGYRRRRASSPWPLDRVTSPLPDMLPTAEVPDPVPDKLPLRRSRPEQI